MDGASGMMERTKAFIKSVFPGGARIYRRARGAEPSLETELAPGMEEIFSGIYRRNEWADPETVSGRGSTLARTEIIRGLLPALLESVGARTMLDAPCGDFNWLRYVDLRGVEYIGADVVPELVERNQSEYGGEGRSFVVLDITRESPPRADVILCRDCFIHLSFQHIFAAVANFKRSGSAFLLATTHSNVAENMDTPSGGWRPVNLLLPPFNFPPPERLLTEDAELGKQLGLWMLEEL